MNTLDSLKNFSPAIGSDSEESEMSAQERYRIPLRQCAGMCGRQVEVPTDWDWFGELLRCPECEEAHQSAVARKERLDRLDDARIPVLFRGFDLKRTSHQARNESEVAFVRRVEALERTIGVATGETNLLPRLKRWFQRPRPRASLWLMGPPGTGKTLAACALAERVLRDGESVLFLPEPEFFSLLAAEWATERSSVGVIQEARGVDLLVMDGANALPHRREPPKPWMARALMLLVSSRSNACRPIVWTSQDTIDAYARVWEGTEPAESMGLGGRIYHSCERAEVLVVGPNWREEGWNRA